MPRRPTLLSLLNLMLKPIAGQTRTPSKRRVALPQQPSAHDREAWGAYWKAQGQHWRTEPEIGEERQHYLAERRLIPPDIEHGIYPFRDIKLNRADIEWLLVTHENGQGPVNWYDKQQRKRLGLDLRGADLRKADLHNLPLARTCGGSRWLTTTSEWLQTNPEEQDPAQVHLEEANLRGTHLEGANLIRGFLERAYLVGTHLEGANLSGAHMEDAYLIEVHLEGANLTWAHLEQAMLSGVHLAQARLKGTFFDNGTTLENITLGDEQAEFATIGDVRWGGVDLSMINWQSITTLGDEQQARRMKTNNGERKNAATRLNEYQAAVRANRQLSTILQSQGLNEQAARFAYHAQVLQIQVFWLEMLQRRARLKQRSQAFGAWLFSLFLFLLAGYGYRLWRSFLAYILVIIGFTSIYYMLGASFKPPLSLVNALGLSMTSFHGRGFFPGVTQLNDPVTILASIEAFVGLVLEATFIATLTQRFFGK